MTLRSAVQAHRPKLDSCVHCGFCLPTCPTYRRLGDEADSPRGRLYLMRAVVEGRLDPGAEAFQEHIDRCLGCRACESVCPSGVEYGLLLEEAREEAVGVHRPGALTRIVLRVFQSPPLLSGCMRAGRILRGTGAAGWGVRVLPSRGRAASLRLASAMLAATGTSGIPRQGAASVVGNDNELVDPPSGRPATRGRVALLAGCVQEGLYRRVNRASRRVLEANGFAVVETRGQGCCGALHSHAGTLKEARTLARKNVDAFGVADIDWVVVNAAGCGATMKGYGHLLGEDPSVSDRALDVARKTRDLLELLAEVGPRPGAPLGLRVAYDAPCHLLHGQRVERAPLRVLEAVPGLEVEPLPHADECCGGAGLYGLTHPRLGASIGDDKVREVLESRADGVTTPNPGCMMQIGAGLRMAGSHMGVWHPVELLDESYRLGGVYGPARG